jgi:hypothetical protein
LLSGGQNKNAVNQFVTSYRISISPARNFMKHINRFAAIIKPKQPYVDWANSFNDGGPTMNLENARKEGNAYLIPQFDYSDQAVKYVEKNYATIFENELRDWITDPEMWPKKRTLKMFKEWFDIEINEPVHDLGRGKIVAEKY